MSAIIRLVSQEGEIVEIDQETAVLSVLIKSMLDDSGPEEDIPLPNVTKPILEKVIEFCRHLKDNPLQEIEKPLKTNNLRDIVSSWYADYVELEQEVLFEVILAANYLDIRPLLELTWAKVATMIKGKSVVEVRKLFSIENDFTPEEEAQILEENKWAEEAI